MNSILALGIFLIAYFFIATEKFNRIAIAVAGAGLMLALKLTDAEHAFFSHETGIDWNVIFLLLGMMIIVSVVHKTGFFEFVAMHLVRLAKGRPVHILVSLSIFIALASAILDNVTTIMLAVPMIILVAKKVNISPIPLLLAGVFSSNIGGAATLIGDPPNIIIASKADISFNDFLIHMAPMVVVVLIVIIPMMVFMFRKQLVNSPADRQALADINPRDFLKDIPLLKKSGLVLIATIIAFITHSITQLEPSVIALIAAGVLVAATRLKPRDYALDVEWGTLLFFAGLFIMVGTLVKVGVLAEFANFLAEQFAGRPEFATYSLLGLSAVLSGIVDNIPYVASMSPVVADLSTTLVAAGDKTLWWALAFGADFGGNATIVGASANIVAIGLAAAAGVKISFWNFAKYGIPVTIVSTLMIAPYLGLRYLS